MSKIIVIKSLVSFSAIGIVDKKGYELKVIDEKDNSIILSFSKKQLKQLSRSI